MTLILNDEHNKTKNNHTNSMNMNSLVKVVSILIYRCLVRLLAQDLVKSQI